jgi:hypothetical protein
MGCDLTYPEVVVVNNTAEHVLLAEVSFNGCRWNGVLGFGDATEPRRCLPGSDRVHVKKFDADSVPEPDAMDPGLQDPVPRWFAYRTVTTWEAGAGDFRVIEVVLDDLEQDFSVPGPYGH